MSHFSVLVVTKTGDRDELERALQPFHEYECTGIEDQYVVEVDKTDEVNELYTTQTETKWVDQDGVRHSPYDDRFYREAKPGEKTGMGSGGGNGILWHSKDWGDGRGYRAKVHMTAEEAGMKEIEVPISEVQSIAEFALDYGGWYERDGRFYDKTNPSARWDWWEIGGRYAGRLLAMDAPGRHDRLKVKNVDFETMKRRAMHKRRDWIDELCAQNGLTGDALLDTIAARNEVRELWLALDPRSRGEAYPIWVDSLGDLGQRAQRIELAPFDELPAIAEGQSISDWITAAPAITFFAALKDGNWYEKGKMGWFAFVLDEKEADAWTRICAEFLAGLDPEEWITFVDCHI